MTSRRRGHGACRPCVPWSRATGHALAAATAAAVLVSGELGTPGAAWAADDDQGQACDPAATQYVAQAPAALAQLGASQAWTLSRGGVLVAVVDSGVDATNAHLPADTVVLPGLDLVDPGGDGRTDASGHGTAVAGQVAARAVDGSGVVGLAPDSTILPVRVYASATDEDIRDGRGPTPERTAEGITWAADHGAAIVVVPQSTVSDVDGVLEAAVDHASAAGALVVASAGNADDDDADAAGADADGDDRAVRFPAGFAPALSVTAVGTSGNPTDAAVHATHVEIAAPGAQVATAFLGAGDCVLAADTPSTSYAAGYVAAAAALVAAAHPDESPADWEYRLLATALRPSRDRRDDLIGWGIVAPYDAINLVDDGGLAGPANPRFPAAAEEAPVMMARPSPTVDPAPRLRTVVATTAGAGLALLCAALLVARLRRPR